MVCIVTGDAEKTQFEVQIAELVTIFQRHEDFLDIYEKKWEKIEKYAIFRFFNEEKNRVFEKFLKENLQDLQENPLKLRENRLCQWKANEKH